jgi:SAM-dependent methyltransferase
MYDAEYTKIFYNSYDYEWSRLEASPYGRLQSIIHEEFLLRYIKPGDRVLDAGSGPGRFSIIAAHAGADVTLLDISDRQLEVAKQKVAEAGYSGKINSFLQSDICDLSRFQDGSFDLVICFGGALSYVCEKQEQAAKELLRVLKRGGILLVSVMSRLLSTVGFIKLPPALKPDPDFKLDVFSILETGDLPGFFSPRVKMMHASMHLFTADELKSLFKSCKILEIAGSNVTISEPLPLPAELTSDLKAWETLVELERRINHDPGLVNSGSHIIMAARKGDKT